MTVHAVNRCPDYSTYRAARVKSMFNAEKGCEFEVRADLPLEGTDWKIGLIVGPSGSGKSTIGRHIFPGVQPYDLYAGWPEDAAIVEAVLPGQSGVFDQVTGAFSAVGLGDVPAWLRPFHALSNGQQFRAGLARLICEAPPVAVVDEFTSVVDRQIARIGAAAFGKAWRRTGGQVVLLSCHYDVAEWLQPDWVYDTCSGKFARDCLRRPGIELEICEVGPDYWPYFEPHHYLKLNPMPHSQYYVGFVAGKPVAHLAVSPWFHQHNSVRACRMVVMPEWQGAGVGMRFLNEVCRHYLRGHSRWGDRVQLVYFHTSHPGLAAAMRRDTRHWVQVSGSLYGGNGLKSIQSFSASAAKRGQKSAGSYFGGHFRAVQGFRTGKEMLA